MNEIFVPETIEQCKSHYLPPNHDYINCLNFGYADGMNGSCHWCREMTPYQWHMCLDAEWLRMLLKPLNGVKHFNSKEDASLYIEQHKQEFKR